MKYLVWLLIVLAGLWWLRQQRTRQNPPSSSDANPKTQPDRPSAQPTAMLACSHCGVLCPDNDMVRGQQGHYCSDAHRQQHEG